jgi:hypothetical protein
VNPDRWEEGEFGRFMRQNHAKLQALSRLGLVRAVHKVAAGQQQLICPIGPPMSLASAGEAALSEPSGRVA